MAVRWFAAPWNSVYRWLHGRRVGEKVTRGIELAIANTSAIYRRFLFRWRAHDGRHHQPDAARQVSRRARQIDDAKLPYISLLTGSHYRGVTASFAMLGDLNIAEPVH